MEGGGGPPLGPELRRGMAAVKDWGAEPEDEWSRFGGGRDFLGMAPITGLEGLVVALLFHESQFP